jgi:hypothetical protein
MKEFIEKLIARLEESKGKVVIDGKEMYQEDYFIDIDDAIEIVKELAEEHNGGWIPTSERLPEKDGYYLITSNGRVYETYYQDGFWLDPIEFYRVYRSVTAWQNLPAPYNPKGE